jgi:hypothetical protein
LAPHTGHSSQLFLDADDESQHFERPCCSDHLEDVISSLKGDTMPDQTIINPSPEENFSEA